MTKRKVENDLVLRLGGPLSLSDVPLSLLARKLDATQRLLFAVGSSLVGGGARGTWKAEVLDACTLHFVEARAGNLEIVARIPTASQLPIVPGLDLGSRSLEALMETLESVSGRDFQRITQILPDSAHRARVVNSALALAPAVGEEYELTLVVRDAQIPVGISMRQALTAVSREEAHVGIEEVRTITGRLYRIEVATGERQLGLLVRNRRIPCFYAPAFEEVVKELVPGSVVEVDGTATLNDRGEVQRIEAVIDARPVQLEPLTWSRVNHEHRRFVLSEPLRLDVDFTDGTWVHENSGLGIIGYGGTRHESLNAVRVEFAALWDGLAEQAPEQLTLDAQDLRERLRRLVRNVEEV